MKVNKRIFQLLSLTLIVGLLAGLFLLTACEQAKETVVPIPNTGAEETEAVQQVLPGNVKLLLHDGTQLEMLPLTELQVIAEAPSPDDLTGTLFSLVDGQVVIVPNNENTGLFTVFIPGNRNASLQGCAMAASYSSIDDSFAVYCVGGLCKFNATTTIIVNPGTYVIYKDDMVKEQGSFDEVAFEEVFNTKMPVCLTGLVPVTGGEAETETPEPTADTAATATAACSIFQQQFPSTPCP